MGIEISEHFKLVWDVIEKRNYKPPQGMDKDDLFQIGCIGLMKAITKYNQSIGVEFSTHAVNWIRSEFYQMRIADGRQKRKSFVVELHRKVRGTDAFLVDLITTNRTVEDDVLTKERIKEAREIEPVITRYLELGFTQKKIANKMGITHQRVSQRIKAMRKKLAAC